MTTINIKAFWILCRSILTLSDQGVRMIINYPTTCSNLNPNNCHWHAFTCTSLEASFFFEAVNLSLCWHLLPVMVLRTIAPISNFVLLFLVAFMMFGVTNVADWTACRDACRSILPGARSYLDPKFDICYGYFCSRDLMNSLYRSSKMKLFLRYTGCKDIHSFEKHPDYPDGVYHCKWNITSFQHLTKINTCSQKISLVWLLSIWCRWMNRSLKLKSGPSPAG